ncbi:MAG: hypothetical protein KJ015_01655 [Myxococcales bacterium]|nr:hypothetical protein [Myxococcales bacterium]
MPPEPQVPMLLRGPPRFADLVFHVLAHVRRSAGEAASVYDPEWVRFAASHLGPAESRTLAEDADALGQLAPGHEALSRLQLVAWLFADVERARVVAARELADLGPDEVDAPELLATLRQLGPAPELLRVAAELERPFFERLPAPEHDWARSAASFEAMLGVAPELGQCTVELVRSLRLRGRVRGSRIWVGVPDPALGPTLEHVSWQAAHEATVREVGRHARAAERRVEQMAVVLLAARARRQGRDADHGRWLAHFGANAPETNPSSLDEAEQRLVSELLG